MERLKTEVLGQRPARAAWAKSLKQVRRRARLDYAGI